MSDELTRADRLLRLLGEYGQEARDYDEGEEEDPRPYLTGEQECEQWCCVTEHDGKHFFLPTFHTADQAAARAVEYVEDDIWAETPVEVHNLDTGESLYPVWDALRWSPEKSNKGSQHIF